MEQFQYKRERSGLWITIYHNDDDSYNISTGRRYVELLNYFFPMFELNSPTKWKNNPAREWMSSLWLPAGRYLNGDIERFKEWCFAATSDILWLGLNKNINTFFYDELDFCIACDFNYVYGNSRTVIGEAEYQLKYKFSTLQDCQKVQYANILTDNLLNACRYIPISNVAEWCLSPMPALESGKNKLAWSLSEMLARRLAIDFVDITLLCDKPQMKQLPIEDKIRIWNGIYAGGCVNIKFNVNNKNVLIVDDLYQSGASMWEYARYLKSLGARSVWGLVCVKSLKDSDNI